MVTAVRSRRSPRLSKRRTAGLMVEALEDRQLFSLLGIDGPSSLIPIQRPQFSIDLPGSINYNSGYSAAQGEFTASSTIATVRQTLPDPSYFVADADLVLGGVQLQFLVNKADGSIGGHNPTPGADDLDIYGKVTIGGVFYDGSTTPLLRATVSQFGFDAVTGSTFDFRLHIVGGLLANTTAFAGSDLGISLGINPNADPASLFNSNFSGTPKGIVGPIPTNFTTPKIVTVAGNSVVIGSNQKLTDSAVLSDGNNPTGTITFKLYDPSNAIVDTEVVAVTGNGSYAPPAGFLPTVTGTYLWSATYSGDSLNASVADNGLNENEVVTKAGPAINTVAGPSVVIGSGVKLTDSAVLSGAFNPTGSITFKLYNPLNVVVDTEVVTVNGNGSYAPPAGFLPTVTGTYLWSASYSGDINNTSVADNGQNENEVVTKRGPAITTQAGPSVVIGSGIKLTDSAVLSGAYNPTGTITFKLYNPLNVVVSTQTVTVNGNGTYAPALGYLPTTVGTYLWSATYSGDVNNTSVADNGQNENEVVTKALPCLVTQASITYVTNPCANVVGSAIPQDQAILSGGYNVSGGSLLFTLKAPDGTIVDSETIAVTGVGTYKTKNANAATQVGTYTWLVTYSGDALNLTVKDQGGPAEQVTIGAAASLSGHKYLDLCGDGLTSDDTGMGGVTIQLYADTNNSGVYDTGDALAGTTVTASGTGAYAFNNLIPGRYFVKEVTPTGFLQTGPTSGSYTTTLAMGDKKTGFDFDNFKICDCKNSFSCISYIINGCKTVTDLSGNVHQGDTVKVIFTLKETETVSLVSYTAPDNYFVAEHASQQKIFDVDMQTFGPGTHCLTIVVPDCFYQVDFICGCPITTLGPAGTNIFYTPQNRLIDSDNGGTTSQCNFVTNCNSSGCISGTVFCDKNNNGKKDSNEGCIPNVKVVLTGTCNSGEKIKICVNTDSSGNYKFNGLKSGCFKISEGSCDSFADGKDSVGTKGGTLYNDVISSINLSNGATSSGNNFAELDTSSISGTVYKDTDRSNSYSASKDQELANVKITLTGYNDLGTYVTVVTYTDANGNYTFDGLRAGTYTLVEAQPIGYTTKTNTVGTSGGTVSGDSIKSIALGWATDATSYNFGEA